MTDADHDQTASGTWHYGLVSRWWAEVNQADPSELAFLRAAMRRYGEPALDLGCGTGRLLLPLLAEGFDVDGTDISPDMIERVREGAAAAGIDLGDRLAVQPFDGLDRVRRYGTVFSIGSFAIGGSADRDAAALRRVHDHLLPGGAAILSYEVAGDEDHARMADASRPYPRPWPEAGARAALADGDELELLTRASGYDAATRTHRLEIRASLYHGGEIVREEEGSLLNTYYRPEDVARMLHAAGFADIAIEGAYTGRSPEPADDTVVMVARRVS